MPQTNRPTAPSVDAIALPFRVDYSCSWCAEAIPWSRDLMSPAAFPPAFVWTKIQAEAGQPLDAIVRRKELERRAGDGLFFWGIGSALGENLRRLIARDPAPAVLFSIMRSKPKRQDVDPGTLLLWTAYADLGGRVNAIPPHALVLSRGETGTGEKRRHYALVCRSMEPLRLAQHGSLNASHFRNLGSATPRIGASQVTAVVEHETLAGEQLDVSSRALTTMPVQSTEQGATHGPTYDVNMRAELASPYFVRLARPLLVPADARAALANLPASRLTVRDWMAFIATVRAAAAANTVSTVDPENLFGFTTS